MFVVISQVGVREGGDVGKNQQPPGLAEKTDPRSH
jgi:hypothetical protein